MKYWLAFFLVFPLICGADDSTAQAAKRPIADSDRMRLTLGSPLTTLGVAGLKLSRSGDKPVLQAVDAFGNEVATIVIDAATDTDLYATVAQPASSFSLAWVPSQSYAEITDETGVYRITFDVRTRTQSGTAGAEQVFQLHQKAIAVAMETIAESQRKHVWSALSASVRPTAASSRNSRLKPSAKPDFCDAQYDSSDGGATCGGIGGDNNNTGSGDGGYSGGTSIICNGPKAHGAAYFSGTKSQLCAAARAAVDLECWNYWCTGCCSVSECNAYCILGDYLCVVGSMDGTSCSPSN